MAAESRLLKYIRKYFNRLGVRKIENVEEALLQSVGEERTKAIMAEWDRILPPVDDSGDPITDSTSRESREFPSEHTDLYDLINSDMETSLTIGSFTDADIWQKCCLWLMEHQNGITSPALEIGCGNGVITCFLASIKPEIQFVGIDRSQNSIMIANQIKEKLGITNVSFEVRAAEEITEKYNTVLSFRTIHENIGSKYTWYKFETFSKQLELYGELYSAYIKVLGSLVEDGGKLFSVERNEFDTEFLAMMQDFNDCGLCLELDSAELLECRESDFANTTQLAAYVLDKMGTCSDEELFEKWSSLAFEERKITRAQADYVLEMQGGELIYGVASFDKAGTPSGKFGIYEVSDDPNSFFLYQANPKVISFHRYPMSRKEEAMNLLTNTQMNDLDNGFTFKDLETVDWGYALRNKE